MSWFKIDDTLHGHPRTRAAGLAAMGLWAVAGAYSAAYKLEGYVPAHYVRSWPNGAKLAAGLVKAGLWHAAGDTCECIGGRARPDGWTFHDWQDYNPTAGEIEQRRVKNRERQARFRAAKRTQGADA